MFQHQDVPFEPPISALFLKNVLDSGAFSQIRAFFIDVKFASKLLILEIFSNILSLLTFG